MLRRSAASHAPLQPAAVLASTLLDAARRQAPLPRWLHVHALPSTSPAARQVLWRLGRKLSSNPALGFRMADLVPEHAIGDLWQLYRVAPTLRALMRDYDAWSPLLLEFVRIEIVDEDASVWMRMVLPPGLRLDRAEQDFRAAMTLKLWRRLHGDPSLVPEAVHFTYPRPAKLADHRAALGTQNLCFEQSQLAFAFSRAHFDKRLPGADAEAFEQRVEAAVRLARQGDAQGLADRVDALLTELLAVDPRESTVAQALGMSVRSLRRALSGADTSFRALLSKVRARELELFIEAQEPSERRAKLAGFANPGALRNFLRALRGRDAAVPEARATGLARP